MSVGGWGSQVTGWGEWDRKVRAEGESGSEEAELVVGEESNGF
jgi:hypothetical protein